MPDSSHGQTHPGGDPPPAEPQGGAGLLDGLPEQGHGAGSSSSSAEGEAPAAEQPPGAPAPSTATRPPASTAPSGEHNVIPLRGVDPHQQGGPDAVPSSGGTHASPSPGDAANTANAANTAHTAGSAASTPEPGHAAPESAEPAPQAPSAYRGDWVAPQGYPAGGLLPEPGPMPAGTASVSPGRMPDPGAASEQGQHAYPEEERRAVYRAIRERRDVRSGFRPDPIPDEVLTRILEAAHRAPSVGLSQPWDFVLLRDREQRERVQHLAHQQRDAFARDLPGARARAFTGLKVEAILDTPVNIAVTVDPTRGGRHTLGRHAQPQTAAYSASLAVQNLWLAARAEGLGIGWVSFFAERDLAQALELPAHLEVVAYLCVGYVNEFPPEPELALGGWAQRRPLSWAVHSEEYGQRGLPGQPPTSLLDETVAVIGPARQPAMTEARERQSRMTKPPGALGVLEDVSVELSGLAGECPPPVPEPAAVAVFAGDHGVHAQGVTHWPQEVTAQMVHNFLAEGAVVNCFARQAGAEVTVVDVGVAGDLPAVPGLLPRKVARGTGDFTTGPAMSVDQARHAVEAGIEVARDLVAAGNRCLLTGDMGIANTTASAALIATFTGRDAAEVTGRGTGVDDPTLQRKVDVVRQGLEVNQPTSREPLRAVAAVGGLEHAALAGFILGAAAQRVPVILDGVIAGAAALVATAIAPEARTACVAGHRSSEPGHAIILEHLELRPLVDLELRLGEGSGALLALPLVQGAIRALRDVATFDAAGVTDKRDTRSPER
ncbi:nicotinate-nucleotide--dimethylbenzimidazole phosphoribosyltransferase [Lipingzhangella sp. LS1_29]|uniref:Nicotinate-nucleotide--dimethylbenzimidazole phosphoribosyltransferase n=1 Tax=Lipingzhangella rawalii TaxID=2055835 RepID=A0ABU2H6Z5_9ACTN|nr:nicotinate-nucleotide--dimethylbenzimidazole phosphoribosyltransferase [Lipingzhangella rawalii]MDS1271078.1 nicotinate-nucleotide--dimethylbenzimidazole phosphoribosyltransferase [Lipingzhangella rawalii]